ncbi:MAG: hypothetical protein K6G88_10940 [Lachnospiraceae bacterium]|nr:hypothetical protein [Lachnospiraceae bacterium]
MLNNSYIHCLMGGSIKLNESDIVKIDGINLCAGVKYGVPYEYRIYKSLRIEIKRDGRDFTPILESDATYVELEGILYSMPMNKGSDFRNIDIANQRVLFEEDAVIIEAHNMVNDWYMPTCFREKLPFQIYNKQIFLSGHTNAAASVRKVKGKFEVIVLDKLQEYELEKLGLLESGNKVQKELRAWYPEVMVTEIRRRIDNEFRKYSYV